MSNLPLAPTTPLQVTVNFTAAQRPYMEEYYNAKKKPGETPGEFATRILVTEGLRYRRQTLAEARHALANTNKVTEEAQAATDIADILADEASELTNVL